MTVPTQQPTRFVLGHEPLVAEAPDTELQLVVSELDSNAQTWLVPVPLTLKQPLPPPLPLLPPLPELPPLPPLDEPQPMANARASEEATVTAKK
jgi:hypothetical protein